MDATEVALRIQISRELVAEAVAYGGMGPRAEQSEAVLMEAARIVIEPLPPSVRPVI